MAPLFKSKQKNSLIAIFDIGSSSVGGALVNISQQDSKNPSILFYTRNEIIFHKELDFNVLLKDMTVALNKTSDDLCKSEVGAPKEIFCVLSSPWYISESKIIKIEKKIPFIFSKHVADELLKREMDLLISFYNKKFGKSKSSPDLIENQITSVFLNGYKVEDPINKKAKKIKMNLVVSFSPQSCTLAIKETLLKSFHHRNIKFSSFNNLSFIGIQNRYINTDSYILMDIGGEVTDVNVVSRGVLEHTVSFPFGRRTLYRFLSKKLNKEVIEIQSLFNMYISDTLEKKQRAKIDIALNSIEQTWGEAFLESVKNISEKKLALPNTIFLITNVDISQWFANLIRDKEYVNSVVMESKCSVINLEATHFNDICDLKSGSCDPFLMIEAIALSQKNLNKKK